jgi:hypothetical protein
MPCADAADERRGVSAPLALDRCGGSRAPHERPCRRGLAAL